MYVVHSAPFIVLMYARLLTVYVSVRYLGVFSELSLREAYPRIPGEHQSAERRLKATDQSQTMPGLRVVGRSSESR